MYHRLLSAEPLLCCVRDGREKKTTIWLALVEKMLLKVIRNRIEGPLLRYCLISWDGHRLIER